MFFFFFIRLVRCQIFRFFYLCTQSIVYYKRNHKISIKATSCYYCQRLIDTDLCKCDTSQTLGECMTLVESVPVQKTLKRIFGEGRGGERRGGERRGTNQQSRHHLFSSVHQFTLSDFSTWAKSPQLIDTSKLALRDSRATRAPALPSLGDSRTLSLLKHLVV